eukprot:s2664_g5.t1
MGTWYKAGSSRGSPPTAAPGETVELLVYDDAGNEQGTILLGVLETLGRHKDGLVIAAMFLGASDLYYHWWMNEGPNAPHKDRGIYHLCMVATATCPSSRKFPNMIHGDKYRNLGVGMLTQKKIPWLKDKAIREAYEFCYKKFKGVMGDGAGETEEPPPAMKKPRAAWADKSDPSEEGASEESPDDEDEESTSSDDEAMAAKIKKLRQELKKAEDDAAEGKKKRKAMKKARTSAGKRHREEARVAESRPAKAEIEGKAKKKKKKKQRDDETEEKPKKERKKKTAPAGVKKRPKKRGADGSGSGGEAGPSRPRKKKKPASEAEEDADDDDDTDQELFGVKAVEKGALKHGEGDRGPFGGGAPVKFGSKDDDTSESESHFQKGLTGSAKTSQQRLLAYTQRYLGRLASRMLLKMEQAVARGAVGPTVNEGRRTPPVALNHILTVLLPSLGQKAGLRSTRELKTLGTILDQLASGCPSMAADTVTQRIKAVERATHEGHWGAAQHLELLAPENTMLIEKDEEMFMAREYLLEQKLKHYDRPGPRRENEGKGKSKGAKGKNKDGSKGDKMNWDKGDKGPKKAETK